MTLSEALEAVDREYDAEVGAFTEDQAELCARHIESEHGQIMRHRAILADLIGHVHGEQDLYRIAVMAIRYGMRVQRKLDDPQGVTTIIPAARSVQ